MNRKRLATFSVVEATLVLLIFPGNTRATPVCDDEHDGDRWCSPNQLHDTINHPNDPWGIVGHVCRFIGPEEGWEWDPGPVFWAPDIAGAEEGCEQWAQAGG